MKLRSLWDASFLCFVALICAEEQCNLILKADPLYIFFGEQTNFSCTFSSSRAPVNSSENNIVIKRWNGHNLTISSYSRSINTITAYGRDVVSVHTVREGVGILTYVCTSPLCEDRRPAQFLTIEHRPQQVTNGSCLVYNWRSMTCVWDLGVVYLHGNTRDMNITAHYNDTVADFNRQDYNVSLQWSVYTHLSPCKNIQIHGKCLTCEIKENDGKDSFKGGIYVFVVNITSNRRAEASASSQFYFNTDELVQPAKVDIVKIDVNETAISLSWSHSEPFRPLQFKIEYKSEWENVWRMDIYTREIEDLMLSAEPLATPTREMSATLLDLSPYTTYDIRISCKPIVQGQLKGLWSKFTTATAKTLEDVPSVVPIVHQSFFSCMNTSCSEVEIYWESIKLEYRRTDTMLYKIELISPKYPHNKPIIALGNSVSTRMSLNINTTNNITILPFNGKTNKFPNLRPSNLVIPPKSDWPNAPIHFEALSETSGTRHVTLTWSYPDKFKVIPFSGEYAVVWCRKTRDGECQGEFNWLTTILNTSHRIEIPDGTFVDNYTYGIAANGYYEGVKSSSGIVWADCVHFNNLTISEKLYVQPVIDDINVMKLVWNPYNCKEYRGHVIQYVIKYCELRNCQVTSVYVNVSRHARHYKLEGLSPTKYRAWVSAVSDAGQGPSSEVDFVINGGTMYSGDNGSGNRTIEFIVIFGIIGLVLLFVLAYCLWKHCRITENIEIKVPYIFEKDNSLTTSGMGSAVLSSDNSSQSANHVYSSSHEYNSSSNGSGDSGCGHMKHGESDMFSTEYVPLQIHSSHVPDSDVRDKCYGHSQFDSRTDDTDYHREKSSECVPLLEQKDGPISAESAYVSDTGSNYRSQLPSANCEELQPLVTQAQAHESDDSSVDNLHYSMEDISHVLDQSGSTAPSYVLDQRCSPVPDQSVSNYVSDQSGPTVSDYVLGSTVPDQSGPTVSDYVLGPTVPDQSDPTVSDYVLGPTVPDQSGPTVSDYVLGPTIPNQSGPTVSDYVLGPTVPDHSGPTVSDYVLGPTVPDHSGPNVSNYDLDKSCSTVPGYVF